MHMYMSPTAVLLCSSCAPTTPRLSFVFMQYEQGTDFDEPPPPTKSPPETVLVPRDVAAAEDEDEVAQLMAWRRTVATAVHATHHTADRYRWCASVLNMATRAMTTSNVPRELLGRYAGAVARTKGGC